MALAHVPRTGGTSLTTALRPWAERRDLVGEDPYQLHVGGRACVHLSAANLAEVVPPDFLLVATVREPGARLLSMFEHQNRDGTPEHFERWARRLIAEGDPSAFYLSQTGLLVHGGELLPDVLLHFEQLEADWSALCRDHLPEPVELPWLNPSRGQVPALELARRLAAELWPDDVGAFGYA